MSCTCIAYKYLVISDVVNVLFHSFGLMHVDCGRYVVGFLF